MWARTGCATERGRGALTGGRAWTGCPDRRQSASAAHALTDWQGNTDTARCTALVQRVGAARALTDWQGNTDTARCTALVQRVGAARALTTGRQHARFPIDRRGVLLYPVSIGLKRAPPPQQPDRKTISKRGTKIEKKNFSIPRFVSART